MKILLLLSVIGAVLLFLGGAFFFLIVHPAWMLVDCSKSELPGKKKTIWIIAMLVGWPLAGMVYGFLRKENRLIRNVSLAGIILTVLLTIVIIYGALSMSNDTRRQVSQAQAQISRLDWSSVTQTHKAEMEKTLAGFRREVDSKKVYVNLRVNGDLAELLTVYLKDGSLSDKEIEDWVDSVNQRYQLDSDRLHKRLEQLKSN